MKKQLSTLGLALFAVTAVIGMSSTALAETDDDNEATNVNVTVNPETALDVKPDQLDYEDVQVGDRITQTTNGINYTQIKVENTGSNAIQRVWLETTYPSTNPFGQGAPGDHDSGNFLQVKPNNESYGQVTGDDGTYHYVQRTEFFQEDSPLVDLGDFGTDYDNTEVGRIRAGNNEFYFALGYPDSATGCQEGELRIGDISNKPSSIGTNDFDSANSGEYSSYDITGATESTAGHGITNSTVSLQLDSSVPDLGADETQDYDILTKCEGFTDDTPNEPHLLLTRYNIEAGTTDNLAETDGNIAQQIWNSADSGGDLSPGESFGIDIGVQIPRGVPNGDITEGTLTVYSQASN